MDSARGKRRMRRDSGRKLGRADIEGGKSIHSPPEANEQINNGRKEQLMYFIAA